MLRLTLPRWHFVLRAARILLSAFASALFGPAPIESRPQLRLYHPARNGRSRHEALRVIRLPFRAKRRDFLAKYPAWLVRTMPRYLAIAPQAFLKSIVPYRREQVLAFLWISSNRPSLRAEVVAIR